MQLNTYNKTVEDLKPKTLSLQETRYNQTNPPKYLSQSKIDNVLNFLAFSGTPIHVWVESTKDIMTKLEATTHLLDTFDQSFSIKLPDLAAHIEPNTKAEIAFGYKRKRAKFSTMINTAEDQQIVLEKPKDILLTNLRKNPRVYVSDTSGMRAYITAETQTGKKTIENARISEISQLGISLFVERKPGILLPGDSISSLEVYKNEGLIFKTSGITNRIDLNRSCQDVPDSYEIIILYKETPEKEKFEDLSKKESRRTGKRHPILDEQPCFFTAEHPLFPGQQIQGRVYEISSSGLSCLFDKTHFPIVKGMNLNNCSLQLPFQPNENLSFRVAHVDFRSDGEQTRLRVGGEFISTPISLLKNISKYVQTNEDKNVEDLQQVDLDLLWEFMFETNFIYENKRKQIQKSSVEILETYRKLTQSENKIVKKLVYKEDEEIKGHLSAVRFYDQAWLIQHLNASKTNGGSAAQKVLYTMIEFLRDAKAHAKNNLHYVISFYRPNNIYPAILFGKSAEIMNNPSKATTFDFSFGLYNSDHFDKTRLHKFEVKKNEQKTLNNLIRALLDLNMGTFVRAIGLSSENPETLKITDEFESLGLMRNRSIYSLKGARSEVYAIAESSSPGLNLSELTNCIYLFDTSVDEDETISLTNHLLSHIYQEIYLPLGINPTVMQPMLSSRTTCVDWSKNYTCWILNENAMQEFDDISQEILNNFRSYLAELMGKSKKDHIHDGRQSA